MSVVERHWLRRSCLTSPFGSPVVQRPGIFGSPWFGFGPTGGVAPPAVRGRGVLRTGGPASSMVSGIAQDHLPRLLRGLGVVGSEGDLVELVPPRVTTRSSLPEPPQPPMALHAAGCLSRQALCWQFGEQYRDQRRNSAPQIRHVLAGMNCSPIRFCCSRRLRMPPPTGRRMRLFLIERGQCSWVGLAGEWGGVGCFVCRGVLAVFVSL